MVEVFNLFNKHDVVYHFKDKFVGIVTKEAGNQVDTVFIRSMYTNNITLRSKYFCRKITLKEALKYLKNYGK